MAAPTRGPDDLIHYRCSTTAHQIRAWGRPAMTSHNGRWAYCPAGLIAAHRWTETGGVRFVDLLAAEREYDRSLLSALSAAETLFGDLNHAIGVTTLRLEVARVGVPLCVDVGERWSMLGRALFEVALRDSDVHVGRVLFGDDRRENYNTAERETAERIIQPYAGLLRRWLSAEAIR